MRDSARLGSGARASTRHSLDACLMKRIIHPLTPLPEFIPAAVSSDEKLTA